MRSGTFDDWACGGRKRLKFISHLVEVAAWLSLRSLPPKEAIVALVVTDILSLSIVCGLSGGGVVQSRVVKEE